MSVHGTNTLRVRVFHVPDPVICTVADALLELDDNKDKVGRGTQLSS